MTKRQIIKNKELKKRIIQISYDLKLSHIGSNLTAVDTIELIYAKKNPEDKFVLSSGHAHLAHLVVEEAYLDNGFEADKEIEQHGIHCDRKAGCDVSTGSLGHGIGIALGMALADRDKKVYCIISDGETAEGSVWEALRIQKEQHVDNLLIYCLINGYGAYKKINQMQLSNQLEYMSWCTPVYVDLSQYGIDWLKTQEAHYKVMNKKEYEEFMEILQ